MSRDAARRQARDAIQASIMNHYVVPKRDDGAVLWRKGKEGADTICFFTDVKLMRTYLESLGQNANAVSWREMEVGWDGYWCVNPDPNTAKHDTLEWKPCP